MSFVTLIVRLRFQNFIDENFNFYLKFHIESKWLNEVSNIRIKVQVTHITGLHAWVNLPIVGFYSLELVINCRNRTLIGLY